MSITLAACTSQTQLEQRIQAGNETLQNAGFEATEAGLTKAWVRDNAQDSRPAPPWHVYIEGDGAAWQGQGRPSANPTPQNPVALYLAAQDPSPRVVYLARPCQFFITPPNECHFSDWTSQRYAPRQAERLGQALKALIGEETAIFIGFSGGAHLALQIAEHHPTRGIVSVAGNLDDLLFSRHHRLAQPNTPPTRPTGLPIWSLSGAGDAILPPHLAATMLQRISTTTACQHHQIIDTADHTGPWQLDWSAITIFQDRCLSAQ